MLSYATNSNNSDWRKVLMWTLWDDPRPGISSSLASCQSLDLDYKGTIEVIRRIAGNLSEANGVIRLASVTSTEQRYCYQYQKPPHVCKKVGCLYRHEMITPKSSTTGANTRIWVQDPERRKDYTVRMCGTHCIRLQCDLPLFTENICYRFCDTS